MLPDQPLQFAIARKLQGGIPLQHQALGRLRRLLVAVGFQDSNRCFRVALFIRELHEGFNLVDGGEVLPGEGVLEFGLRFVGYQVFA